jgi:TonB family protein
MRALASLLLLLSGFTLAACSTRSDEYRFGKDGKRLPRIEAEQELVQDILRTEVKPALDSPLKSLYVRLPEYPRTLARQGDGPTVAVNVQFKVKSTGEVSDVKIVGVANTELAEICMSAVREWRFEPPTRDGKGVELTMNFRIRFAPPN